MMMCPLLLLVLCLAASCDGTPSGPACVGGLSPSCSPLYDPPAFATIQDKILRPNCATGSATCHTADAARGGLVFDGSADLSYRLLLGQGGAGGRSRVVPGDPGCSLLMKRLKSTDPSYHMPPGPTSLLDGELCTIVQWISQGAKR